MFGELDVRSELNRARKKSRRGEDVLLSEAKRILRDDLFADKKILSHLRQYTESFDVVNEESVDLSEVFTEAEIRRVAIEGRLKFLDSKYYKPEIPYSAVMKIRQLNKEQRKDLKAFRILSTPAAFNDPACDHESLLFVKTGYENYYLVQKWGRRLPLPRKALYWPLRSFECLVATVILFTLCVTMALPTRLITLDATAGYWSGYRAAAFFHLLIFDLGFTTYLAFAFSKNFSSSVWDRRRDFS